MWTAVHTGETFSGENSNALSDALLHKRKGKGTGMYVFIE